MAVIRVAFIGYGHLGKFLVEKLREQPDEFDVVRIWNRSVTESGVTGLETLTAENLAGVDLVVEVAHPNIIAEHGRLILEHADLFVGSPTCFADQTLFDALSAAASRHRRRLLVPSGALWGANDIQKMAEVGSLRGLTVTMSKHPSSFKLGSPLRELNERAMEKTDGATVLFEGSVRDLCPLAPNNVNTMAGGAIAASNLGFSRVRARLIADPALLDWHIVEVRVEGDDGFDVVTRRANPAKPGAVTGHLTYYSFLSSIRESRYKPAGRVQLC